MKWLRSRLGVVLQLSAIFVLFAGATPNVAHADLPTSLIIDQVRITTDDQFVRLRNIGSGSIALSDYELIYFNSENKPTKTLTFSGTVPKDGYYMLNDAQMSICYQMQIDAVSLGFSTTSGALQLWHYTSPATKVLESSITWIKTRKADTPATVVSLPTQTAGLLQRQWPVATPEWMGVIPSATDPCSLMQISDNKPAATSVVKLSTGAAPPVNVVSVPEGYISPKNDGMIAPVLNEVLPNPASPLSDDEDEFVELYNPNDATFDLSGYKITYGTGTSPKTLTFAEGTVLEPKSYTIFTSGNTSLSLSNTAGQVWLNDPNGVVISQTEPYAKAPDNQSWALVNGKWAWMTAGSPNAANDGTMIVPAGAKTSAPSSSAAKTGTVKGATTTSASTIKPEELEDATPLHPTILAGIGAAAVGYAIYEYRHDFANTFHRIRRNMGARRGNRAKL